MKLDSYQRQLHRWDGQEWHHWQPRTVWRDLRAQQELRRVVAWLESRHKYPAVLDHRASPCDETQTEHTQSLIGP